MKGGGPAGRRLGVRARARALDLLAASFARAAADVARARPRVYRVPRLSYDYTHRWIVFAVRMVTELSESVSN